MDVPDAGCIAGRDIADCWRVAGVFVRFYPEREGRRSMKTGLTHNPNTPQPAPLKLPPSGVKSRSGPGGQ